PSRSPCPSACSRCPRSPRRSPSSQDSSTSNPRTGETFRYISVGSPKGSIAPPSRWCTPRCPRPTPCGAPGTSSSSRRCAGSRPSGTPARSSSSTAVPSIDHAAGHLMPDAYVIWSIEHQAWGRPARRGYAETLEHAGHYTAEEARAIVADATVVTDTTEDPDIVVRLEECLIPLSAFGEILDRYLRLTPRRQQLLRQMLQDFSEGVHGCL